MNRRNNVYIRWFNPKRSIRLANNKYQSKTFLSRRAIPVPKNYAYLKTQADLNQLDFDNFPSWVTSFVMKPNHGSKWQWIYIVKEIKRPDPNQNIITQDRSSFWKIKPTSINRWYEFLVKEERITEEALKKIISRMLDGRYSSQRRPDSVILEEKLIPSKWFSSFCEYGLADIRIIMFNLVPVLAMLRMPTALSWWKANLAQGGVGFGIDIVTGRINTLYHAWQTYTKKFPDPRSHFYYQGIEYRQQVLEHSANAQYFVNSGYLWMDWVITKNWPKLLEINARSGLEIQNINNQPLLHIMRKIEDINITDPQKWLEISKSLFWKERISTKAPQNVIYLSQLWKLYYTRNNKKKSLATTVNIDLQQKQNSASKSIFKKLEDVSNISLNLWENITPISNINFVLDTNIKWNTVVLWQENIWNYYIKPEYKKTKFTKVFASDAYLKEEIPWLKLMDNKLSTISRALNLTSILNPINYLDEFDKFIAAKWNYNPQFVYNFPTYKYLKGLDEELDDINNRYRQKDYFSSKISQLFYDKVDELHSKIQLLIAYKKQDINNIKLYNDLLFWTIDEELLQKSYEVLKNNKTRTKQTNEFVDAWYVKKVVSDILEKRKFKHRVIVGGNKSRMSVSFSRSTIIVRIAWSSMYKKRELPWILAHELEVHARRYLAGKETGRHILRQWTAQYIITEEWLAVYSSEQAIQKELSKFRNVNSYGKYILSHQAESLSFAECYDYIHTMKWYYKSTRSYKWFFDKILKQKKWIKDTSQTWFYGKDRVYAKWHDLVSSLTDKEREKLISIWKIKYEDLDYFK